MVFIGFVFLSIFNQRSALCCIIFNEGNFILMGCRTSSFDIGISKSNICIDSPLTEAERIQFETIISGIPVHCRQIIHNLPPRQLLNFYQYHTMAIQHGLRKEWPLSISYEHRALKGLQTLLPTQKDHYIFLIFIQYYQHRF